MKSNPCIARQARRCSVGFGIAVGAVAAAAMIGVASAPAAHADPVDVSTSTDLGLLDAAAADMTEANDVLHNLPGVVVVDLFGGISNAADVIDQFEAIQAPLLSSDNSFFSGLGHVLFDYPDQQLNQASDAFLSAVQSFAADPSSLTGFDVSLAGFQYTGTVLFDSLLPNVVGEVIDQLFGLEGPDAVGGSAADVAASAGADAAGSASADLATGFDLPF
jgi:hypothetical protein